MSNIEIKYTNKIDINRGVKSVISGPSNVGKTRLALTAEHPFIISSENGLLSLRKEKIPYVEVKTAKEVEDVHQWILKSSEAKQYWTVICDSGSDLAEVTLSDMKKIRKDGRAAHGETTDIIGDMFRDFREMYGKHIVIIAKETLVANPGFNAGMKAMPLMPNQRLQEGLPYMYDLVLHMFKGVANDGSIYQALHCQESQYWFAKDRSGRLDPIEYANLSYIFRKVMS
jgi:hypothetical protein